MNEMGDCKTTLVGRVKERFIVTLNRLISQERGSKVAQRVYYELLY